jgi:hypothetical protein
MRAWIVHLRMLSKNESVHVGIDSCYIWDGYG